MQRFWARFVILVMVLTMIPVSAAQAATTKAKPALVSVNLPSQVTAGQTADFTVTVTVDKDSGLSDGSLALKGPSGQTLSTHLARANGSTSTELKGQITFSPNAPVGVYSISSLLIRDNDDDSVTYNKDTKGFAYSLTVTTSGQGADTKGPKLTGLTVTDSAEMGDPITITATAEDDLSGVNLVYAYVEPVVEKDAPRIGVQLFATDKAGVFSGNMLADLFFAPTGEQRVVKVSLYDKAGNNTVVEGKDLTENADLHRSTSVKPTKVDNALVTSSLLRAIHPGDLAFWNWAAVDRNYVLGLLNQASQSTTAVRERIAGDLGQLQSALDQVRKEVYVDPKTGLKVSPFATTGKWMALDQAFTARLVLLAELDRREGKNDSDIALTAEELSSYYSLGRGVGWLPVDGGRNEIDAQLPAAIFKVLAKAPLAVNVMKTPANESPYLGQMSQLDRDVIYFQPVVGGSTADLRYGTNSFTIAPGSDLTWTVTLLFGSIGQHFGEAYVASYNSNQGATKWAEYYALRGGQTYSDNFGWLGSPPNNLNDDFAYTFLPLGLGDQYFSTQSFPRLRENPDMAKAFKEYVTKLVGNGSRTGSISVVRHLNVGVTPNFTLMTTDLSSTTALSGGITLKKGITPRQLTPVTNATVQTFTGSDSDFGELYNYFITGKDASGRIYVRTADYVRLPLMLDALSGVTNRPVVTVSGQAPNGATVTIQDKSTTAGSDGRFRLDVPLKEGDNLLKATVSGSPLAVAFKVTYTPASKVPKLTVTLPGTTADKHVGGTLETDPYSIVVIGDVKFQIDSAGRGWFYPPLNEGKNKVQVTVTNPAGNQATWTGNVTLDTQPPKLDASVPKATNLSVYTLIGSTDPGAQVTLNDNALDVDSTGNFTTKIALADGQTHKLVLVATDPAGNQTTVTKEIRQVKGVATNTRMAEVALAGTVDPNTTLTYLDAKVKADANGRWQLPVKVGPGRNVYDLVLTDADGKPAGFLEYVINNPLTMGTPTALDGGKVKVSGQTAPGYSVMVDGKTATVDEKGNWSVVIDKDGRDSVIILVDADEEMIQETVTLP